MTTICYIHGLNSSHHSFAYISKELGGSVLSINYNSYQPLDKSIVQVAMQLPTNEPIILVGHSLGGVIAMRIAAVGMHNIQKVVTISSPLGGSRAALFASMLSGLPVLRDIVPGSVHIKAIAKMPAPCPVLSIITTGGLPMPASAPNDSVVTVASQMALTFAEKVEIKASHFEVLLHDETVNAIRDFIK
jgi:pimeloyl-ACP methyl ester carboxylesterase